jgi:hypothetical protein
MKQDYGPIYQNIVFEDEYYGLFSTEERMWQLHWAVAELRQREQEDQRKVASQNKLYSHPLRIEGNRSGDKGKRKELVRSWTLTIVRCSKEQNISNIFQAFIHAFPRFLF